MIDCVVYQGYSSPSAHTSPFTPKGLCWWLYPIIVSCDCLSKIFSCFCYAFFNWVIADSFLIFFWNWRWCEVKILILVDFLQSLLCLTDWHDFISAYALCKLLKRYGLYALIMFGVILWLCDIFRGCCFAAHKSMKGFLDFLFLMRFFIELFDREWNIFGLKGYKRFL